ncbi:MAG: M1 family aminopeptidase [candidate division WOR-3 bacterium]
MKLIFFFMFSLSFVRPYPFQRSSPGYDVLHYNINLKIRPETRNLSGYVEFIVVVTENSLNSIKFEADDLFIDSVRIMNRKILSFFYPDSDLVEFVLPYRIFKGETLTFKVYFYKFYPGNFPVDKMRGVFFHPSSMVFTFSEPQDARRIFPCWDEPYDKATLKIKFNVPYGYEAISNGLLMQKIEYPQHDSTVFVFYESHNIATYLIAFSIYHKYQILYDYYQDKPLFYYAVDEKNRIVAERLKPFHKEAIDFFSKRFLNYPFSKYGVVSIFDFPGGMENQTITFVNPGWWSDTSNIYKFEYGFIHELAHQWFGDFVTPSDWKEIWLNEGFASYMEVIWAEFKHGRERAIKILDEFKNLFFSVDSNELYPIFDPRDTYFNGQRFLQIIYKKGAYVLHMLRKLIGDNNFFNAIKDYLTLNAYGNVTISDFQSACEKYYGNSLFFFFEEWLTRSDYPVFKIYDTTYPIGANLYLNEIRIRQRFPPYILPLKVALYNDNDLYFKDLWIDDTFEIYKIQTLYVPDSIVYNPEKDILCKIIRGPVIKGRELVENIYVFNNKGNVFFNFKVNKKSEINIKIFDGTGRNVRNLVRDILEPGEYKVLWTGKSSSGRFKSAGNYFLLLEAGGTKIFKKFILIK